MSRKLTAVGVLAALVLAVAGLTGSAAATPAQSFCSAGSAAHGGCTGGLLSVHSTFCFDDGGGTPSMPVSVNGQLVCGPHTSNTAIPVGVGVPIRSWEILDVPIGARPVRPVSYLPAPFSLASEPIGGVTGGFAATADLLCDGSVDVLSSAGSAPAGGASWPGSGWPAFPLIRQNVGSATPLGGPPDITTGSLNGYVDWVKPMPSTFMNVTLDRANVLKIWLGGTVSVDVPPTAAEGANAANQGAPLQRLETASPYIPGLHVGADLLNGVFRDPTAPPPPFLCLDSPQSSLTEDFTIIPPSVPGNYVRWTALQSAADTIDGTVTRILDVQCLNVGDAAGTCDFSDADGDLVPAAVEAVNGICDTTGNLLYCTNPALADTDADGATDFDELFQFTNPLVADTDGDGSLDKQDDLADFDCIAVAGACTAVNLGDTTADDNCPVDANSSQDNTDSQAEFTNTPNTPAGAIYRGDATNPHQDHQGDACDIDADNDGFDNIAEVFFEHPNLAPGLVGGPAVGTLYCLSVATVNDSAGTPLIAVGGWAYLSMSPLNPDSDSDGGLDGRECPFGSDPLSALSGSCQPTCAGIDRFPPSVGDTDGDKLSGVATAVFGATQVETFYRTQHINLPNGGTLDDLEQPGSYRPPSPPLVCTDPNASVVCDNKVGNLDNDSDGDFLNDGVEVKWYATSPANFDTDGDGCSDGREAADVNGDHKVDTTDLLAVAQHSPNGSLAPNRVGVPLPLGLPAGRYNVAGHRRDELATYDVNKDGKIDTIDLLLVAKLSGNCAAGVGAQTAQPIERAASP
jgi:hypothetical protein